MQARVAKNVGRIKAGLVKFEPLKAYVAPKGNGYLFTGLAGAIFNALERPGVAPTTKPKSEAGRESFHFALTTVSRTSPFTRLLTGEKQGSASAHESYIERDDAPEAYDKAAIRQLEALGRSKATALPEALEIAIGGQAYIERAGAIEEASRENGALSMYGNLPDNFAQRLHFWDEVEKHEREPRTHFLSVAPDKNRDLWATIASNPAAPPELLAAAALDRRVITKKHQLPQDNPKSLPGELKLTEERALAIHSFLAEIPGAKDLVKFTPGRGGQIQSRLIISLPYELSADDRIALLKSFCDKMFRNLETTDLAGNTAKVDVPFWAVVHKPEATSDSRNYHAHIVFSERPAALIADPETGSPVWDFAYREKFRDSKRTARERTPFAQAKIRSLHDRHWPRLARHTYADLANEMLAARGLSKRLDPRTYEAMGITLEPVQRLKPNEYAKEKKGEASVSGEKTIEAQWDRIVDSLDKRFPLASFRPAPWIERKFDTEVKRWTDFQHPAGHVLASARSRWRAAWYNARHIDAEAAAAAVAIERVRSKIDAPGKSMLPENPVLAEFLTAMADQHVSEPRETAQQHRAIARAMEQYLSKMSQLQGPITGNILSQMLHKAMPSLHPHKIRLVDRTVALSESVIAMIHADIELTPDVMRKAAIENAKAEISRVGKPFASPKAPAPPMSQKPLPSLKPVPPNVQTAFKSTAGHLLTRNEALLFKVRKIKRAADQRIAYYEWQEKDMAERLARIKAMEAAERITTSTLIDPRPLPKAPAAAQAQAAPAPNVSKAPSQSARSPVTQACAPIPPSAPTASPQSQKPVAPKTPEPTDKGVEPQAPQPAPATLPPEKNKPSSASKASNGRTLQPGAIQLQTIADAAPSKLTLEQSRAPVDTARILEVNETSHSVLSPTVDVSPPSSAMQVGVSDTGPATPTATQPVPEPPHDPKAIEHRRKRRRAVYERFNRTREISR